MCVPFRDGVVFHIDSQGVVFGLPWAVSQPDLRPVIVRPFQGRKLLLLYDTPSGTCAVVVGL